MAMTFFISACEYQLLRPSSQNDGFIMSPAYPELYPSGLCFMWVYYGRPGTHISIRLLDVDIPSYLGTCSNDFLMIGPINEHSYCGNIDRNVEPYEAQLTNLQYLLFVVFNSTTVGTKGRGFKLYYQFSNTLGITTTTTAASTPSPARNTTAYVYPWSDLHSLMNCHFVFTSEVGEIVTNSTVFACLKKTGKASWLLYDPGPSQAEVNYKLIFEHCYLPYQDKLKIYDGYRNTDSLLRYFNNPCPSYLVSTQHGFYIEYLRLGADWLPSFRIQFVMVKTVQAETTSTSPSFSNISKNPIHKFPDTCVFQLSDHSGEIKSDDLVSPMRGTGYCTWLLQAAATEGHQVVFTLTFERFRLSDHSFLKVYDGGNMSAPALGTYTSSLPPFTLTSSQDSVFVYYQPGGSLRSVLVSDVFTIRYNTAVKCPMGYEACGYGEFSCVREENRCDGLWHCPLHGGDERGCVVECPTDFSCDFRSSNCYSESDRCNGKGTCSNYMDELGCDEARCSPDKGLFLCKNGRCIYEKWRCDKMNDCFDNSDEEDCSFLSSPRVIVAAIVGSLSCALLLVIAAGCVVKCTTCESTSTAALAEMFHHRAPPPPYHEAMLTSRPFDEAYLELLGHTDHPEASSVASDQTASLAPQRERSHRSNSQSNRRYQLHQLTTETGRLVDIDPLPALLEVLEDSSPPQSTSSSAPLTNSQPPPYTEGDPSPTTESYCTDSEDEASEIEAWHGGFDNSGFAGDEHARLNVVEALTQQDVNPSMNTRIPGSLSSSLCVINSHGIGGDPQRNSDDLNEENGGDKDATENASTSLSVESPGVTGREDGSKSQTPVSDDDNNDDDDDSDSDCILDGNNIEDSDGDDTDSDTACILGHT
ncbi:unnamed protein product [Candidula unifasciata]|uniref:CUB domain-containing protein n=1 Tax=Candidula unifasciata TaxID=100452 RepID=A0A8S3YZW2_9EUPU|nr:unnamed protein product [Candidula unifasciata]